MKKEWHSDWLVMTIGVATSIYMLFMVQALWPYLVGNGLPHVHQPSMSPLLERVLVCITFPWSLKDLVHLESTLATIATYETNVHTLVLTDDESRLGALLIDWGRDKTTEAVQTALFEQDGQSCRPPKECTKIIERQVSANNYTSIIHLEPGTRLTWAALASWALDTEVLEPLNLTRCFYHTMLSPETGEKVMMDWVEPKRIGRDGGIDAMLANPVGFERVSSRIIQHLGGRVGTYTIHRHFFYIGVQSCSSIYAWVFTSEKFEKYMGSLREEGSKESTRLDTTGSKSSCVVPYMSLKRRGDRLVLAPEADVFHGVSPRRRRCIILSC